MNFATADQYTKKKKNVSQRRAKNKIPAPASTADKVEKEIVTSEASKKTSSEPKQQVKRQTRLAAVPALESPIVHVLEDDVAQISNTVSSMCIITLYKSPSLDRN